MKIITLLLVLTSITSWSITPEEVYAECVNQGIEHPHIVTAQAIQETGWFKCTNCSMRVNNIFGFYYKGSYKEFKDWRKSVSYYKRWQDDHYKGQNYYQYLNCLWLNSKGTCVRYARDPEYTNKLKSIVKKYYKGWVEAYLKQL